MGLGSFIGKAVKTVANVATGGLAGAATKAISSFAGKGLGSVLGKLFGGKAGKAAAGGAMPLLNEIKNLLTTLVKEMDKKGGAPCSQHGQQQGIVPGGCHAPPSDCTTRPGFGHAQECGVNIPGFDCWTPPDCRDDAMHRC